MPIFQMRKIKAARGDAWSEAWFNFSVILLALPPWSTLLLQFQASLNHIALNVPPSVQEKYWHHWLTQFGLLADPSPTAGAVLCKDDLGLPASGSHGDPVRMESCWLAFQPRYRGYTQPTQALWLLCCLLRGSNSSGYAFGFSGHREPWESHPVPWSDRDQALLKVSLIWVRTWCLDGRVYSEIWPPNCMYQTQWKGLYPWPWPSPLWLSPKGINSKAISQCLYVRNLTCRSLPGGKTLVSTVGKERISRIIKPQKFWVSQERPDHLGSTQEKHTYTLCIWLVLDFYSWTV